MMNLTAKNAKIFNVIPKESLQLLASDLATTT
jgi:hypothetical protein